MIGLDTNVLVRYLMQDDKKQFSQSEHLIETALEKKESLHICLIVLCEVIWVLKYTYELQKKEILQFLELILHSEKMEIENRELALNAFYDYQKSQADFADCLIGYINRFYGCRTTFTFDKKALKIASFTHL